MGLFRGVVVQQLRLLTGAPKTGGHDGEVLACAFTPDGRFVLSAGWDGHLRLWEAAKGAPVSALAVGPRPLSACAVTPDGQHWLSGSMDGMLGRWDALTHQRVSLFLAHTRPISALVYAADTDLLATASWDGQVVLWQSGQERAGRTLTGHRDIVAGCRFTPDGKTLVSWAYDGTVRVWDAAWARPRGVLTGHADRVTAGAVSPLGRWFASGSRDRVLKVWDLTTAQEVQAVTTRAEIRACFFLLDGESLVVVEGDGQLSLRALPGLEMRSELATRLALHGADLAPGGGQLALAGGDGRVHFVAIDGFDAAPLVVTPTQTSRVTANVFQRLLGQRRLKHAYQCTCPACRESFELAGAAPTQPTPCPHCHRQLRLSPFVKSAAGS
jgi:WD40 repeat protein